MGNQQCSCFEDEQAEFSKFLPSQLSPSHHAPDIADTAANEELSGVDSLFLSPALSIHPLSPLQSETKPILQDGDLAPLSHSSDESVMTTVSPTKDLIKR
jgi:hypothetical protein